MKITERGGYGSWGPRALNQVVEPQMNEAAASN